MPEFCQFRLAFKARMIFLVIAEDAMAVPARCDRELRVDLPARYVMQFQRLPSIETASAAAGCGHS